MIIRIINALYPVEARSKQHAARTSTAVSRATTGIIAMDFDTVSRATTGIIFGIIPMDIDTISRVINFNTLSSSFGKSVLDITTLSHFHSRSPFYFSFSFPYL